MGKKVKPKKKSRFSQLRKSIGAVFKELTKAPPAPENVIEEVPEETHTAPQIIIHTQEHEQEAQEEHFDIPEIEHKEDKRDEVLTSLDEATKNWRQTGDLGVDLPSQKSIRERLDGLLKVITPKLKVSGPNLSEMTKRIQSKLKQEKANGQQIDAQSAIWTEWNAWLSQLPIDAQEREEIDKIYRQLSDP